MELPYLDDLFDENTMSIHIIQWQNILAKSGFPGSREMTSKEVIYEETEINELLEQIREEIPVNKDAFLEIDNLYSKVYQIWLYRIVVVIPPLAKKTEITVVRSTGPRELEQYELDEKTTNHLLQNTKGIMITGAPWEWKSTFATAYINKLATQNVVIKTIEAPRDLQVHDSITQYSFAHAPHDQIRDILLLSRPDYTIYDEVRNKEDIFLFKDLRLTGIWLVWVMHATHAIDSIQRMLGTVELWLIPQIVDTVIYIKAGKVDTILTLEQTVKVPAGMESSDLSRPVLQVTNMITQEVTHELYSYGDSVVVMPLDKLGDALESKAKSGVSRHAKKELERIFFEMLKCKTIVEIDGTNRILIYIPKKLKPRVIWSAWSNIQEIEKELWLGIWVRTLDEYPWIQKNKNSEPHAVDPPSNYMLDLTTKGKKSVLEIILDPSKAHQDIQVMIWDKIMNFTANHKWKITIRRKILIDQIQEWPFAVVDS